MKALTRHEQYLFAFTGSAATTPQSQRAAIARCGLSGLTAADIDRVRRENWRSRREQNPTVPAFVLAAQAAEETRWEHKPPGGVRAGAVVECADIRRHAHDGVDWGRLRKHSHGVSTAIGFGVREEDNGKGGWDRVVWRYADYGLVRSPDRRKVAISVCRDPDGRPAWTTAAHFRGRFFFDGKVRSIDRSPPKPYSLRLRDCLRLLRQAGFTAYLTRQTEDQIRAGSASRGRRGKLVLIVDFGSLSLGYYHAECRKDIVAVVRKALIDRKRTARQAEIDAWLAAGNTVFVGFDDSIGAGNCFPGIESFARQVSQQLGGEVGGIRSDLLLSIRDDQYTRRAVSVAVLRRGVLA